MKTHGYEAGELFLLCETAKMAGVFTVACVRFGYRLSVCFQNVRKKEKCKIMEKEEEKGIFRERLGGIAQIVEKFEIKNRNKKIVFLLACVGYYAQNAARVISDPLNAVGFFLWVNQIYFLGLGDVNRFVGIA